MSSRAEQKHNTRRALIEAALRLSVERGFSSLSLRAVAREAKIAPTSFYRHFQDMDDLGLALVDEVGLNLRQLVREARHRVKESGSRSVVRASIQTFIEFSERNSNLFRLLLGEGAGSTPAFRRAIAKEIQRFTDDLAEDLVREAELKQRPLAHPQHASEAMVTVAFNLGAAAIDESPEVRIEAVERIILEVRLIMRGAEAMALDDAERDAEGEFPSQIS
jgi:AcrR family transcriptional regulator